MDAEKFEIWVMEYLSDELDAEGRSEFEKFLVSNPGYQLKANELKGGELPNGVARSI